MPAEPSPLPVKPYYKNDDWYGRFGYIHVQFMSARYGYADKHGAAQ